MCSERTNEAGPEHGSTKFRTQPFEGLRLLKPKLTKTPQRNLYYSRLG